MSKGYYSDKDWSTLSATRAAASAPKASASTLYTNKACPKDELDGRKIAFRESRDSVICPQSFPILFGMDETGSMGDLAVQLQASCIPTMIEDLFKNNPGAGQPHIAVASFGDALFDSFPFEITQFEYNAAPLVEQVKNLHLEQGGGGNGWESPNLVWYFAAHRVQADAFSAAPRRKGFLFTASDENVPAALTKDDLHKCLGPGEYPPQISNEALLLALSQNWHVYHFAVAQSSAWKSYQPDAEPAWRSLLGERFILVKDIKEIGPIVSSLIRALSGEDKAKVVGSWSGSTAVAVSNALNSAGTSVSTASSGGIITL